MSLEVIFVVLFAAELIMAMIVVPLLGFPENVNSVVFALSLAGGPELLLVLAATTMGQENVDRVLGRVGQRLKRALRWDTVTRRRYRAGAWTLLVAFLVPYVIALLFDDSVVDDDLQPGWGYYVMIASTSMA